MDRPSYPVVLPCLLKERGAGGGGCGTMMCRCENPGGGALTGAMQDTHPRQVKQAVHCNRHTRPQTTTSTDEMTKISKCRSAACAAGGAVGGCHEWKPPCTVMGTCHSPNQQTKRKRPLDCLRYWCTRRRADDKKNFLRTPSVPGTW